MSDLDRAILRNGTVKHIDDVEPDDDVLAVVDAETLKDLQEWANES